MKIARREQLRSGFSLIEVLVATAVLLLLLVIAVNLIAASSKAFQRSEREMSALSDVRFSLDAIGNDLAKRVRGSQTPLSVVSSQGNDSVQFYTSVPSAVPVGSAARGIALVAYRINEDPSVGSCRLERAANGTGWNSNESPLPFVDPDQNPIISVPNNQDFDSASDSVFRIEFSIIDRGGDIRAAVPGVPREFSDRVSAIIVTVAGLDPDARKLLPNPAAQMAALARAFPDAVDGEITAQKWIQKVNDIGALSSETGVPQSALSTIRISQRIYHLR